MGHNFKELKIWMMASKIAIDVYTLTKKFPEDERFGLISQMRRCAVSVASNIAEGCGRNNNTEFNYFLGIGTGSLYEFETQHIISQELGNTESYPTMLLITDELKKMLYSFKSKKWPLKKSNFLCLTS